MKKNTKSILAIIMAVIVICGVFAACSNKTENKPVNDTKNNETVSISENNSSEAEVKPTEHISEAEKMTENSTVQTTESTTGKKSETTTKKQTAAKPKQTTTTKKRSAPKKETTTKKKSVTTTKKKVTTTKKTVKNVTPKEVQQKVNAYIKSKGVKLDSSLTPSNAGWSAKIPRTQDILNNGYTLDTCKWYVDLEIAEGINNVCIAIIPLLNNVFISYIYRN